MAANKKRAKQERLPETTNAAIAELEELGYEYASIRDERMKLLGKEVDLKEKLHDAMRRHKSKSYKYEDLEILIIPGEESVKVHVSKAKKQSEKAAKTAEEGEAAEGAADESVH